MLKNTLLPIAIFLFVINLYSQDSKYNILTIPADLKENANSVIRLENTFIDVKSQREMIINNESVITILNKQGDYNSDITIFYDKTRTIKNVSAIVYDAFGNEIKKIKKKDFEDYSASGNNLFSDSRVIHYDYTPISYPYTIHYKYEIKTSNTAFIPKWFYNTSYYQSIEKSIYLIKYPSDIILRKSENNFDGYVVRKIDEPGKTVYSVNNVPAFKREPHTPILRDFTPYVKLGINKFNLEGVDGVANNWDEFGEWYYENIIKSTLDLPESTKNEIRLLTNDISDPYEKARKVYEYVQDKVRYISIQVGIGGFKPMQASAVDDLSYGDCKALTNYTAALLKAIGIESYHTFLYAGTKKDVDSEVAAVEGNHMILYLPIDNQDLWLECTSQNTSFGDIGDFTDDRDVMVIKPEGGRLMHTRIYDEKECLQTIKGKYSLDNNGHIIADVDVEMMGTQFDNHIQYEEGSPKELEELFKNVWDNINNMNIKDAKIKNNKKEGKFEEKISFTAENYGVKSGDRIIFPVNAFNVSGKAPKRVRDRKFPVDISFGFYDVDEVLIDLPSDYNVEVMSDNVNLETEFGTYKSTITKTSENQLSYKREFLLKNGQYPKEAYKEYRDFRKKVAKADKSKIVLIKK